MDGMTEDSSIGRSISNAGNVDSEWIHESSEHNPEFDGTQENVEESVELNGNSVGNDELDVHKIDEGFDVGKINFVGLTVGDMMMYHFANVQVAYDFYNAYAEKRGFAARKWNVVRNKNGDMTHQTFVCFREGFRDKKHLNKEKRKREHRALTRCGCTALFRVRYVGESGRWHVKEFSDDHSHEMLGGKYIGMLPAHRKMHECDIMQLTSLRDAGFGVTQIYGLAANQSGGYERLGFRKRDMYNEIEKQRRILGSDVRSAFSYLRELSTSDSEMFWRYTIDDEGRLEHLFWCDGRSQADYQVFGDVVAFDATYRRNKYMSPFVVFAGVNHHNQTIVFGSGLIANETEETYVWLLKQFVEAMKGKLPTSVITDGDLAMKNAIRDVFSLTHHRLCAWHLLRNATSNISNPRFTSKFRRCMLGDYDVGRFRSKWEELIKEFDLHGNQWIKELYEKRKMWATAHIRGNFFAGFRTTSRCEGMHAQVGRYVHYRNNLTEFLKHFSRYLAYTRQREVEADFQSVIGEPVMITQFQDIERSAALLYTRKVFFLFRPILERASGVKVVGCEQTPNSVIYIMCKRSYPLRQWYVSIVPMTTEFKCSCLRMESIGIPCEHIVALLHYLEINELPKSLVLIRWTKNAKQLGEIDGGIGTSSSGSTVRSGVMSLLFDCYEICRLAGQGVDKLDLAKKDVKELLHKLRDSSIPSSREAHNENEVYEEHAGVKDPARVRTKGCGPRQVSNGGRGNRRTTCCSICQGPGHNKKTCPLQRGKEDQRN